MNYADLMRDEARAPYRDQLAVVAIQSLEGQIRDPMDAVSALSMALAAVLKTAPFDVRGEITAAAVAQIQGTVRESLQ